MVALIVIHLQYKDDGLTMSIDVVKRFLNEDFSVEVIVDSYTSSNSSTV